MLYEVMREVNNFFEIPRARQTGSWTITSGSIDLPFLQEEQYFLIEGSVFNDGLHKNGDELTDETFTGDIYPLAIPKAFSDLVEEISEWFEKYGGADSAAMSPYSGETFEGYSYSKASGNNGSTTGSSDPTTWQGKFAAKLSTWRKV